MAQDRLVAVSYPADDEFAAVNTEVLAGDADVVFTYELDDAGRAEAVRHADALLSWEQHKEIPAAGLSQPSKLRLVQFLSAGVDAVDFAALPEWLAVASNAGAYAGAVSEHAVAMTLSLAKRLQQRHASLAVGRFDKWSPSLTLDGAICGILGFGGIGMATAHKLRACRTTEPTEFAGSLAELDVVLAASDVLVVSLPLTLATRGLIGARELALMKADAILVNVARGPIIDQLALYEHLRANAGFCAGIDTWWNEPATGEPFSTDYPFLELPNVLGSPHNSSIVPGTMLSAARIAAENVLRYLRGEEVKGIVHRSDYLA
jgi:phosphoglycerate dehydrogenase-like enzyme